VIQLIQLFRRITQPITETQIKVLVALEARKTIIGDDGATIRELWEFFGRKQNMSCFRQTIEKMERRGLLERVGTVPHRGTKSGQRTILWAPAVQGRASLRWAPVRRQTTA